MADAGRFLTQAMSYIGDMTGMSDNVYTMIGNQFDDMALKALTHNCDLEDHVNSPYCKMATSLASNFPSTASEAADEEATPDATSSWLGRLQQSHTKQQLYVGDTLIKVADFLGKPFGHGHWVEGVGLWFERMGSTLLYSKIASTYNSYCKMNPSADACGEDGSANVFVQEQLSRSDPPSQEEIHTWMQRGEGMILAQFSSNPAFAEASHGMLKNVQSSLSAGASNPMEKIALAGLATGVRHKIDKFGKQFTIDENEDNNMILRRTTANATSDSTESDAAAKSEKAEKRARARFWENPKFDKLANTANGMMDIFFGEPGYTADMIGMTSARLSNILSEQAAHRAGSNSQGMRLQQKVNQTVLDDTMQTVVRKLADSYVESTYSIPDVPTWARSVVGTNFTFYDHPTVCFLITTVTNHDVL